MRVTFLHKKVNKGGVVFQKNLKITRSSGNVHQTKAYKTNTPATGAIGLDFSQAQNSMYIPIFPL